MISVQKFVAFSNRRKNSTDETMGDPDFIPVECTGGIC